MKRKYLALFSIVILASACHKKLDDFLFNPDDTIEAYYLDDYTGPGELQTLDDKYDIPDSLVHQFSFELDDNGSIETIHAIYLGDLKNISSDSVILYCHGNSGNMDYYWARQKVLANVGGKNNYGILQFDYPGYGLSSGKPSEANLYSSTGMAIEWLKEKGLTSDRFFLYGFSLGSAAACKITASNTYALQPTKLILESPFASAEVMIQDAAGLNIPGSYFVDLKINNAEQIKNIQVPFLWMHGIDDDFLSIKTHGEVVYKNYGGVSGTPVRVSGANHSDLPQVYGYEKYILTLSNFITK